MKIILSVLFLFLTTNAQNFFKFNSIYNVVTDSTVWVLRSVDNTGDTLCRHEFVEGDFTIVNPNYGCLVMHNGFQCSMQNSVKSKICKICLRKEKWEEVWSQHSESPPKTEYDLLNERIYK